MKLITLMPFHGFYETIHEYYLGGRMEDDLLDIADYLPDAFNIYKYINQTKARKDYCIEFVKHVNKECLIELEYESVDSPQYYNYGNDRLFCKIELKEVKLLIEYVRENPTGFMRYLTDNFTSCEGFGSFYSNQFQDWVEAFKTPRKLDHNQIHALLAYKYDFEALQSYDAIEGFEPETSYAQYITTNKANKIWQDAIQEYDKNA